MVITSRACSLVRLVEPNLSAEDVAAEADGMAVSVVGVDLYSSSSDCSGGYSSSSSSMAKEASNIVAMSKDLQYSVLRPGSPPQQQPPPPQPPGPFSPTDLVASKLTEAMSAAASAMGHITTGGLYAGLASLPSALPPIPMGRGAPAPAKSPGSGQGSSGGGPLVQEPSPSSLPSSIAAAAAVAAVAAAGAGRPLPSTSGRAEGSSRINVANSTCPSEWFVCDEPSSRVRYFVIQGSDTLDHWKLNLTFDPVAFEDPTLGVKVRARVCVCVCVCVCARARIIIWHIP